MLRFKFILWAFAKMLKRAANKNPDCVEYIDGKELIFQIQTQNGKGRNYIVKGGKITSASGLRDDAKFSLIFKDPSAGISILTAKDQQAAFMNGIQTKGLVLRGNFAEIMWFQGLAGHIK